MATETELKDKAIEFIGKEVDHATNTMLADDISWASGPDVFTRCYRITFDDSSVSDWIVSFDQDWIAISAAKFNQVI
jgi:hypothetical protein